MRDELSSGIEIQAHATAAGKKTASPRRRAFSSFIPHRSSLLFWLVHISRFGLAALFLFAVAAKLYMINDRQESFFKNMPYLVGERWAVPVAICVIMAEVVAAALLIWPRTARVGGLWAAALLLGFAGYALYYRYGLNNVEGLECGCFGGIIGSQLGVSTALRNLALLVPALLVIFGLPRLRRTGEMRLESQHQP
jgi:Methylamine utilisation protein MauE